LASAESENDSDQSVINQDEMAESEIDVDFPQDHLENTDVDGMALDEVDSRLLESEVVDDDSDVPETVTDTDVPETVSDTDVPETLSDTEVPETFSDTEVPETVPDTKVPETLPHTDVPETLPHTDVPETLPHTDVPETPPETEAPKTGRPDFPRAAIADPNLTAMNFPAALRSTGVIEGHGIPGAPDGRYELGAHFDRIVGPGSLEALERGEELRFRPFGPLKETYRAAVRLDIELYIARCPISPLTVGCLLPNMVHGVGQQHARRSLRLWIVAACLYGTHELLAIPRPGEFSGTIQNDTPVVDDSWEYATISKEKGIRIPWLCVEIVPAHLVRSGSGSHQERLGIDMIREAHSRLRSVVYDPDTGFSSSDFVDHLATPVPGVDPVSQAMCGMVDWKDASVTEFMKLLSTTKIFEDYCLQMAGFNECSLLNGTKIAFQRDYIRHGQASLLAKKYARIKDKESGESSEEDKFVKRMVGWLGDIWVEE
jgi:hypothetical protein